MGVATPSLSVQNWYSDSLSAGCASGDNTLSLNNVPTPSEGYLIIDPNNVSSREVIHYTGKTSNSVTGVTRGVDGTSAQAHNQNTTVAMDYTSSHWLALQDGSAMTSVHMEVASNPYKFSVYRSAAQNVGNGAFAVLQCDTKLFDTGSNIDVATNKGRFTAPIAGFYQFNATARAVLNGTAQFGIALFKNGSQINDGNILSSTAFSNTFATTIVAAAMLQLAANDYIEAQVIGSSAFALSVGAAYDNCFQGFLVSKT